MNSKLAKKIRKYVRTTYPFMSEETLYRYDAFGSIIVADVCQRAFVRNIKKNYKNKGITNG